MRFSNILTGLCLVAVGINAIPTGETTTKPAECPANTVTKKEPGTTVTYTKIEEKTCPTGGKETITKTAPGTTVTQPKECPTGGKQTVTKTEPGTTITKPGDCPTQGTITKTEPGTTVTKPGDCPTGKETITKTQPGTTVTKDKDCPTGVKETVTSTVTKTGECPTCPTGKETVTSVITKPGGGVTSTVSDCTSTKTSLSTKWQTSTTTLYKETTKTKFQTVTETKTKEANCPSQPTTTKTVQTNNCGGNTQGYCCTGSDSSNCQSMTGTNPLCNGNVICCNANDSLQICIGNIIIGGGSG